jgi:hypothetical protein
LPGSAAANGWALSLLETCPPLKWWKARTRSMPHNLLTIHLPAPATCLGPPLPPIPSLLSSAVVALVVGFCAAVGRWVGFSRIAAVLVSDWRGGGAIGGRGSPSGMGGGQMRWKYTVYLGIFAFPPSLHTISFWLMSQKNRLPRFVTAEHCRPSLSISMWTILQVKFNINSSTFRKFDKHIPICQLRLSTSRRDRIGDPINKLRPLNRLWTAQLGLDGAQLSELVYWPYPRRDLSTWILSWVLTWKMRWQFNWFTRMSHI